ncbi:MAG: DUF1569 domain-containing protein [Pirellulales bacterium]
MAVDTRNVKGRRELHFANYGQLLDDVHTLAAGPTRPLGNWSLGQILQHLAKAMNMAIDGPPFKPAWIVRMLGPFFKNRVISRPMSPGFRLPKNGAALIPAESDVAAGVAAIEKAVARLEQNPDRKPHFVFGPMTRDEWDQLQFRHAEMHLSFITPE